MENKKRQDLGTILSDEEMNNFCTYEEIVTDALQMFDEMVKKIIKQNSTTQGNTNKSVKPIRDVDNNL